MDKGLARYFRVAGSGYNHAYGTNRTPHFLQAREGPDPKFGRHLPGSFGAKVIDSYELRSRDLLQRARVFLTVLANPEHGYCNSLAQLHPRLENRNSKTENRNSKTENRKSKLDNGKWKLETGNSKIEARNWKLAGLPSSFLVTVFPISIFPFRFSDFVFETVLSVAIFQFRVSNFGFRFSFA